jgi:hypothetical protein
MGHYTGVRIQRKKNELYYVDGSGKVMATKRRTGGKPGRKSCWPRKSPVTGRKIAHPRFGTEGVRSGGRSSHRKSEHRKSSKKRDYRITGAAARSYVTSRAQAFAHLGHRKSSKRKSGRRR